MTIRKVCRAFERYCQLAQPASLSEQASSCALDGTLAGHFLLDLVRELVQPRQFRIRWWLRDSTRPVGHQRESQAIARLQCDQPEPKPAAAE